MTTTTPTVATTAPLWHSDADTPRKGDGSIDFEALEPMRVAGPDGESGPTFGACFRALDLLDRFRRERLAREAMAAQGQREPEDIVA